MLGSDIVENGHPVGEQNYLEIGGNILFIDGDVASIEKYINKKQYHIIYKVLAGLDLKQEVENNLDKDTSHNITVSQALEIFEKFNIPYSLEKTKAYGWDGEKFYLGGNSGEEIIHELCHWLVANPERRNIPEFGLGSGFSTVKLYDADKFIVKYVDNDLEERITCLLTFIILTDKGFSPIKEMIDTNFLYFYYYDNEADPILAISTDFEIENVDAKIDELIKKGIISEKYDFIYNPELMQKEMMYQIDEPSM